LHSSRQNNHRRPARLSVSRALPNAREPGPPPRAYRDAGTPHGSAAIRFVDYMLGLAAVLILHCRLTRAIRFIHHAAPWRRFFRCSVAASNFRSRSRCFKNSALISIVSLLRSVLRHEAIAVSRNHQFEFRVMNGYHVFLESEEAHHAPVLYFGLLYRAFRQFSRRFVANLGNVG